MSNGNCSNICYHRPNNSGDDAPLICNALFYVLRTGCAWRYLPSNYPCWQTVYYYFRQWRNSDWFAAVNERLRRLLRKQRGRD